MQRTAAASSDFANPGERLYIEGLSAKERQRQRAKQEAQEREEAEAEGMTFQPQISARARELQAAQRLPAYLRLFTHQDKRKVEQNAHIHNENARQEDLSACTFQPQVHLSCYQSYYARLRAYSLRMC